MRSIIISLLMVIITLPAFAQAQGPGKAPKFDPQKFEQQLEASICQRMYLTQAEKNKFLPIFREMRKAELAAMKTEGDLARKGMPKNDQEWAERLKKHDAVQVQLKKIQQTYHQKMIKVIPASKVMLMIRAEEDFHRDAFRKFQGGGNNQGGGRKHYGGRPGNNGNK